MSHPRHASLHVSFVGSAARVVQSFENILEEKIAAITAFGVTITASAVANNSTWPFVTVDLFQQRSASSRSLSGSQYLQLVPIVTDNTRAAWEAYSVANKGWLTEAREYQAEKGLGEEVATTVINPVILRFDEDTVDSPIDELVRKIVGCHGIEAFPHKIHLNCLLFFEGFVC
jgi:hypothetical protein